MRDLSVQDSIAQALAWLTDFVMHSAGRLLEGFPGWLFDSGNRFYWLYLVAFVVCGIAAYRLYYAPRADAGTRVTLARALRFMFPAEIYRHPSAIVDYQLVLMNRLLGPSSFISGLLFGSGAITVVALATQSWLGAAAGPEHVARAWTPLTSLAFALGVTLVRDFATYLTHALHHHVALLWEFHKVHHSAEVLTPVTVYRKHPIYNVFGRGVDIVIVGPVQGLFAFWFVGQAEPMTLLGANIIFTLFHLAGANLRHSHIWLSFGRGVSHIFISPAQHQIHHSRAERHWNKNFGEVFALWDWLFGTLYVPGREREVLEFGIAGTTTNEHPTLLKAYYVPFVNCARLIRDYVRSSMPARAG